MSKTFMANASVEERVQALKTACRTKHEETFHRSLTETDIEKERFDYSENGGKLKNIEAEAKESADTYKEKISVVKKSMDAQLTRIQTGKREVYDTLYGIVNTDGGTMDFFDKYGELISSRKLTADEFTGRIFDNHGEPEQLFKILPGTPAEAFEDAVIVEAENEAAPDDDDLPDFLKPDNEAAAEDEAEAPETPETPKTPRKTRKSKKAGNGADEANEAPQS